MQIRNFNLYSLCRSKAAVGTGLRSLLVLGPAFTLVSPALSQTQTLYVSNYGNSIIDQINTTTGVSTQFGSGYTLNQPRSIAFDPSGNLYVANNTAGNIIKYTSSGVGSVLATVSATGLTTDALGNVYVTIGSSNIIDKITPSGVVSQFNTSFSSGSLNNPWALAFDSSGNLYAANYGNNTIEKFNSSGVGTQVTVTGVTLSSLQGLAFDSSGNLYVSSSGNNNIDKVNTSTGAGTVFNTSFTSGTLNNPQNLAFDSSGNLYVANEYGGPNIEKFNSSGVGTAFVTTGSPLSGAWGLAFAPSTVTPEPGATALLMGLLLPAGCAIRRRRKRADSRG